MPMCNILIPTDNRLLLAAKGVLSTMLNVPEYDYLTLEELHEALPADTVDEIQAALDELIMKEYIVQLESGVYAVNKMRIPQMMLI